MSKETIKGFETDYEVGEKVFVDMADEYNFKDTDEFEVLKLIVETEDDGHKTHVYEVLGNDGEKYEVYPSSMWK